MASLLRGTIYENQAQAPAPSKDYYQLLVTDSEKKVEESTSGLVYEFSSQFEQNSVLPWTILHEAYGIDLSLSLENVWEMTVPTPYPDASQTRLADEFSLKDAEPSAEVIWRWWKISLRSEFRNVRPGEQKNSYQDFLDDYTLQVHVGVIFGNEVLKYVRNLCQHQFDYLNRIPEGLLMYIVSFLELEDIARLSQTSRKFEKVCNSDKLWEYIVSRYCDTITADMKTLALEVGWKEIFFTNKLQLQKKIRRRRQKVEELIDNTEF